tara:strand:- start:77 stop:709 length:633 start_codon:yes stop_codon:yes gene_type:complete
MANKVEELFVDSQIVVHDSKTDLVNKKAAPNTQGVTMGEASFVGFVKKADGTHGNNNELVQDTKLQRGKILFSKDNELIVVRKSYGRFDALPNLTLAGTAVEDASPVYVDTSGFANSQQGNVLFYLKSNSSIKLNGSIVSGTGSLTTIKITGDVDSPTAVHNAVHEFAAGDVLVVDDNWDTSSTTPSATGFEIALVQDDIDATTKTVTLT